MNDRAQRQRFKVTAQTFTIRGGSILRDGELVGIVSRRRWPRTALRALSTPTTGIILIRTVAAGRQWL
jgi:hypothetical protein